MTREPTSARAADRHRAMLEAAETLFLSDGFAATRMADVAARAGVTPNAIYWYFDSKDALLIAVVERWTDSLLDRAEQMIDGIDMRPNAPISLVVGALRELRPLLATLHQRAEKATVVAEFRRRFYRRVQKVLAGALKPTYASRSDAEIAASAIMAATEGSLLRGSPIADKVIDAVVRAAVSGSLLTLQDI